MTLAVLVAGSLTFAGVSVTYPQSENGQIRLSDEVVVRKLAEQIWLHTTFFDIAGMQRVAANGLVVIDGQEAIMIDLPWTDEQTGILCDWVARERDATIKKVVSTHSHIDCAGGLAEAHRRGADSAPPSSEGEEPPDGHSSEWRRGLCRFPGKAPISSSVFAGLSSRSAWPLNVLPRAP